MTKKAIYTREIQNGIEMVLKGHDHNGKEIWVTAEYHDAAKKRGYSKYAKNES